MRWITLDELRVKLRDEVGFPMRRQYLPYSTRIYRVFKDRTPEKLTEKKLLPLIQGPGAAPVGKADPTKLRRGKPLTLPEVYDLPKGAVIWVRWQQPDGEVVIDHPHRIRRSHEQEGVFKLTDLADPKIEELFVPVSTRAAGAADADEMTLFRAVEKRLPG